MRMPTLAQQWAKLRQERVDLRKAHQEISRANEEKFALLFEGKAQTGPTLAEIAREEKAREALDDIRSRMRAFILANA